jgi:hypothetical protein
MLLAETGDAVVLCPVYGDTAAAESASQPAEVAS